MIGKKKSLLIQARASLYGLFVSVAAFGESYLKREEQAILFNCFSVIIVSFQSGLNFDLKEYYSTLSCRFSLILSTLLWAGHAKNNHLPSRSIMFQLLTNQNSFSA